MINLLQLTLFCSSILFGNTTDVNGLSQNNNSVESIQTKTIKGVFVAEVKTPVLNSYDAIKLNDNGVAQFGKTDYDPESFVLNGGVVHYSDLTGRYTISGNELSISVDGDVEVYTLKMSNVTGTPIALQAKYSGVKYSKVQ